MKAPSSPHFTAVDLTQHFNAERESLPETLRFRNPAEWSFGAQSLRGMPFRLGQPGAANVIYLDQAEVAVPLGGATASYLLFLHAVEDQRRPETPPWTHDGNPVGDSVSDYVIDYADGTIAVTPIRRRFAIQQMHIRWGASPFEAVPALGPYVYPTLNDAHALRLTDPQAMLGHGRTSSGRDSGGDNLWLYALANPNPDKPIRQVRLAPRGQR